MLVHWMIKIPEKMIKRVRAPRYGIRAERACGGQVRSLFFLSQSCSRAAPSAVRSGSS